jgi:hypothetical protein
MSNPRFLFDEHIPHPLYLALRQREPFIEILCVGEPGAPPLRTLDPDLLVATDSLGRVLVSFDRKTMPGHLADHFRGGMHTGGVILLRNGYTLPEYVDEILLVWGATTAQEWVDLTVYIP